MIIEKPIITEKSLAQAATGVYTFAVLPTATSSEIRKAVASLYGVTVTGVRTQNVNGQMVRRKTGIGHEKDWKKAFVTVKAGQKIKDFELEEAADEKKKDDAKDAKK